MNRVTSEELGLGLEGTFLSHPPDRARLALLSDFSLRPIHDLGACSQAKNQVKALLSSTFL